MNGAGTDSYFLCEYDQDAYLWGNLPAKSKSNQTATPSCSAGVPDDRASRPHMTGPRKKEGKGKDAEEAWRQAGEWEGG